MRGCAIARCSRSRSARERGPGISVRISIVLVAAISRSVVEGAASTFAPWTRGSRPWTPTRSSSFAGGSRRRARPVSTSPRRWRSQPRRLRGRRPSAWCCCAGSTSAASRSSRTTRAARPRSSRANPDAAVVLNWGPPLRRQVRVEGRVERMTRGRVAPRTSGRAGARAVWERGRRRSPDRSPTARSSTSVRRLGRALRRRRGRAAPALLGRLPPRPARVRALGEPAEPPARPRALRAGGRRLVARAPGAVSAYEGGARAAFVYRPDAFQSRKPFAPCRRAARTCCSTCSRS